MAMASSMPQVNDIRPPQQPDQIKPSSSISTEADKAKTSPPVEEAQKSASTEPPAQPRAKPRPKIRAARKAAMILTPNAVKKLRALLDQPEPKLIKVGTRNRGCSGLTYSLEYVDKAGVFDESVEQDGVKVLIDSKALFSIIGSEMDWSEDKLNQKFVFKNPNTSMFISVNWVNGFTNHICRGIVWLRRIFHGITIKSFQLQCVFGIIHGIGTALNNTVSHYSYLDCTREDALRAACRLATTLTRPPIIQIPLLAIGTWLGILICNTPLVSFRSA